MTDELTLRDKFAIAAMAFLAGNEMGATNAAETAYYIANAMMEARKAWIDTDDDQ